MVGVSARVALASLVGAAAASAAAMALLRWGRPEVPHAAATTEELLSAGMIWAAVFLCGWLGLGSLLAAGATLPGALGDLCDRVAARVTPRLLRRAVAAALGTAVTTLSLPVGPAHGTGIVRDATTASAAPGPVSPSTVAPTPVTTAASPAAPDPALGVTSVPGAPAANAPSAPPQSPQSPQSPHGVVAESSAPDPRWRPSPPVQVVDAEQSRLLAPSPRSSSDLDGGVTVRRGDTLWHIAARHLGPGASDAEIALEWPRWYAANRAVIGPDPDRLLPGQELAPPAEDAER